MITSRKHLMTANLGAQQNGQQQQSHAPIQQQLPHHHHPSQQQSQPQSQQQQQQGAGSVEAQLLRSKASLNSHNAHTRPVPISSAADLRRPSNGSPLSASDVDGSGASSHKPHMICESPTNHCFRQFQFHHHPHPHPPLPSPPNPAWQWKSHSSLPASIVGEGSPHSPHFFFLSHVGTHLLPPFCAEYPFLKRKERPSLQLPHRHLPSSSHSTRHETRFHMPIDSQPPRTVKRTKHLFLHVRVTQ